MPTFTDISVPLGTILEALGLEVLPEDSTLRHGTTHVELDVKIAQDEVDAEASEREPELIEVDDRDLGDGLRALIEGDRPMASVLLGRALEGHERALIAVDRELRR